MKNYHLPPDYVSRLQPDYFSDHKIFDSEVIYQPEVYDAADYLVGATGRTTVIDVGCGNGRKLHHVRAERRIGIDFEENIAFCRERHADWGDWLEADLSQPSVSSVAELANEKAIVICADVMEHLPDPVPLLALLARCYARGAIVVTSTPDRMRVYGYDHRGPPGNPSHVREWTLDEYLILLTEAGLPPIFSGYTLNNNVDRQLRTIVTIHDPLIGAILCDKQKLGRPLAIITAFNEEDVVCETTSDLLAQGCDVVAIEFGPRIEPGNGCKMSLPKIPRSFALNAFRSPVLRCFMSGSRY